MAATPRILPAGDSALTVEFGDRIAPSINDRVLAFVGRLARARIPGLLEVVPTYRSATLYVDPLLVDWPALVARLKALARKPLPASRARGRLVRIPVLYGGEFGPDLAGLAKEARLSPEAVIRLHSSRDYRVYMLGFSPGFPYLGSVPKPIAQPRLAEPRQRVPAGSVGIAGTQTGIYPQESPGGWRLIGRTPLRLYDPDWARPFLLGPGDRVRFVPMSPQEYARLSRAHAHDDRPEL